MRRRRNPLADALSGAPDLADNLDPLGFVTLS
jgi:hypothetical protein